MSQHVYAVIVGAGDYDAWADSVWPDEAGAVAEWERLCRVRGDGPDEPPLGLIVNRWELGKVDYRVGLPLHMDIGHTIRGRELP